MMRRRGGVLLAGLLFFAAPAHSQAHGNGSVSASGSPEREIADLAKNIDGAIKLCSAFSSQAGVPPATVAKIESSATTAGLFRWVDDPPTALKAMVERSGNSARVGQWFDPHATMWILADNKRPACRILIAGSEWTSQVRPALYAIIQNDHYWQMQGSEQPFEKRWVRAEFRASSPAGAMNFQPVISITAPVDATVGGTQLSIGIYLMSKEEK